MLSENKFMLSFFVGTINFDEILIKIILIKIIWIYTFIKYNLYILKLIFMRSTK